MTDASQNFQTRRLSPHIGAEITGIDVDRLDDNTFGAVRQALFANCMLVIRDQRLTPERQVEFSRRWGEIFVTPHLIPLPDNPHVLPVRNRGKTRTVTEHWHSDSMFAERPPAYTILHAQLLPEIGGDTMFANQYLAYERLSPGIKRMIEGMRFSLRSSSLANLVGQAASEGASHPIVRTHPETGRKALYLTTGPAVRLEGMSDDESRVVLELLQGKCAQPDLVYRHSWRPGDLVMWDNRCTQHYAVHDYGEHERLLHRTTVTGERPV
jgi:taurine dioxygenase